MGRVRNAILDEQHELEDELYTLRQHLVDKEVEFIKFEIKQQWEDTHYEQQKKMLKTPRYFR